ncbi:hexosaminidase D isoform X2 [Bicyclus anynana]|uniref:beta-N-acetylhexosaminidase n=1 Tax=Bicyclus anynana TaxID=110368 RepID=A0ABM3LM91_BICAN|nr:hexosaminidase D isoform X2 [Bicyclus anynana]
MHKIVHLDLKGAPLKLPFLEKVLFNIKKWGATGILVEWEDSFPYKGEISCIGSIADASGDGMYTVDEVKQILRCAKENELEVIQLVQTIGHMEFVLKHPLYRRYQEKPRSPAVLCPSQQQGQELVRAMVLQALDMQPDAKYFHIGADEVWHSGVCVKCQLKAASSIYGKLSLYLEHVRDLAQFIKQQRPELTILMWDDILRTIYPEILQYYNLTDLVQPVVWDYNTKENFLLNPQMWDIYRSQFPNVWVGSAFKGASGSCEVFPSTERYVSNQQAWIDEIAKVNEINFVGVILTGWSRYDHFATLCELLPVSMGCLKHCLQSWDNRLDRSASQHVIEILPPQDLPGREFANVMRIFQLLRERGEKLIRSDFVTTWLNPWQIDCGYTNPAQLEIIVNESVLVHRELTGYKELLLRHLSAVTGPRSTEEWVGTYVSPLLKRLTDLRDTALARYNIDASVKPL